MTLNDLRDVIRDLIFDGLSSAKTADLVKDVKLIFQRYNTNHDEKLSFQEFAKMLLPVDPKFSSQLIQR